MTERGSVFIEALVAAAIVAMATITMVQSVGESARAAKMVEERRLAMLVAQSQMATVGSVVPLTPGDSAGQDSGFVWRIQVAPDLNQADLFSVTVTVSDGANGRPLATLRSLRLPGGDADAG